VERCVALVHVLDCGTLETDRNPVDDLEIIESELKQYGGLDNRPRIVALNKIDLPDGKVMAEIVTKSLQDKGYEVYPISAASREGLQELLYAMAKLVQAARAEIKSEQRTRIVIRPTAVNDSGFKVSANADGSFTVVGKRVERWVRQTNFGNSEAVGYLADRLAQAGVEKELFKAGAVAGSEVRIGNDENAVIFDWEPTIEAGAEMLSKNLQRRGSDARLDNVWREEKVQDQLSEDEIARQWEYSVSNPNTPEVIEEESEGDEHAK
jgi:GTP-binding protein